MIVTCDECSTSFRLDAARIPAQGARLRCSRCKHVFFVEPRGADLRDLLEELAGDAAIHPTTAPDAALDLGPELARGAGPPREPAPPSAPEPEVVAEEEEEDRADAEESDWEFSQRVPDEAAAEAPVASASAAHDVQPDPAAAFLRRWDEPAQADGSAAALAETEALLASVELDVDPEPAVTAEHASQRRPLLAGAGWLATTALVLAALLQLALAADPRAPSVAAPVPAGALAADGVRGRLVENTFAGPVFVVSGQLRNPTRETRSAGTALQVVLLGRDGAPLPDARAAVGPALEERALREDPPERLVARLERGADALGRMRLGPSQSLGFDALLPALPPEAVAFRIEEVPLAPAAAGPPPGSALDPSAPVPLPEARLDPEATSEGDASDVEASPAGSPSGAPGGSGSGG